MDLNPSPTLISASRSVRWAVTAALSLLALFLLAETAQVLNHLGEVNTSNLATITVNGTGKASAPPTVATVSFTVEHTAAKVSDAQDASTKQTNDALAALKKLGIADADIQTSGYNVSPQYETQPCAPNRPCPVNTTVVTGYQVAQTVTVKVRDTSKAGDVLGALGQLNVQNVSGPNFAIDDPSGVQAEARGKAIADAKAKAQALAKQLGVSLGRVVGFSENSGPIPYAYGLGGAADKAVAAVAPSIPTGTNETDANVSVTYEIY